MRLVNVASGDFAGGGFDFLTYYLPEGMEGRIGSGAVVPLAGRAVFGYIIDFPGSSDAEPARLKPVLEIIDEGSITPEIIELARRVSRSCFCSLSRTLASVVPAAVRSKLGEYYAPGDGEGACSPTEKRALELVAALGRRSSPRLLAGEMDMTEAAVRKLLRDMTARKILDKKYYFARRPRRVEIKCVSAVPGFEGSLTPRMKALADRLAGQDPVPVGYLVANKIATRAMIGKCVKAGVLSETVIYRDRIPDYIHTEPRQISYTPHQQNAIARISAEMDAGESRAALLHGVTASGKTEVYMALIEKALKEGRTALVLLPEIALTAQVMNIFRSRFGDRVAVLHSNLSDGERLDEWQRARDGRASVVLGARSCVFAPLDNIGLIIIDEEHDGGYKQEDSAPRYHAREVALMRSGMHRCVLLLGSATPSLESYYKACSGEYLLVEMPDRVAGRPLPQVKTAVLAEAPAGPAPTIFSPLLREAIEDCLARGRQVILMQNRRAYSPFIICRSCGWVAKCRNCDVTLKYHKDPRHLSCHHCGFHAAAPARCPVCGGPKLMSPGIGTQKVEEFVRMEFPSARVLRMDSDTTGTKGAHQRIIDRFRKGECDVLVGTQMIAKGLDFPGVTLVGIISADTDLNMPDFRAEERTFQLLSQVAGRAGRGSEPGQVIVQTLAAESPVLELVARHDFAGFYRYELENRRLLAYPPFSRLIRIGSSDRSESAASGRLMAFGRELAARLKGPEGTRVYPAVPAPMKLEKGLYHYNLLIKTREPEQVSAAVWELLEGDDGSYSSLAFDPDPIF